MTWKLKRSETATYFILLVWVELSEEWEDHWHGTRKEILEKAKDLLDGGIGEANLWVRRVEDFDLVE